MREITVATVQMKPELGRAENNLVKMSDFVSTITSQQKVDLIVFPELITSGYELGVQFTELAQRVPGPAINLMAQRAADAGVFIAFGLATKEKVESILYNSAVLVGPEGELVGHYNKTHLRGEERMAFREGFRLPVFDTGEIGRIGLLLGWDLAFPEVARAMALDGAELVCCLANWETSIIDEWKIYTQARAFENALYVAAANRVGNDVTISFGGESMIVGPRGRIYAALETEAEAKKNWLKEQQDLLKEIESLRSSKAQLEALIESRREAEKAAEAARKEAEESAKDGAKEKVEVKAEAEPAKESAVDAPKDKDKEGKVAVADGEKAAKDHKDKDGRDGKDSKEAKEPSRKASEPPKKAEPAEGYCVARIDLDEVRHYREEFQTLQSRQPTVYKAIVRRY
jgi:predicted amidohydrolase